MAVRPEDVLPDGVESTELNGVRVRKGSVAAFVANVKLLDTLPPGSPERAVALDRLRTLAPAVAAVGVLDVFQPRSTEIADLFAESRPAG